MALKDLPVYFGMQRDFPVGVITIFDDKVEERLLDELAFVRDNLIRHLPHHGTKFLLSFEGVADQDGKIKIRSLAIVPDPTPAVPAEVLRDARHPT